VATPPERSATPLDEHLSFGYSLATADSVPTTIKALFINGLHIANRMRGGVTVKLVDRFSNSAVSRMTACVRTRFIGSSAHRVDALHPAIYHPNDYANGIMLLKPPCGRVPIAT
jgi:hypothetical protein